MAKQKNIKVVYQVDTSQVKAATQAVNQAKTATKQLSDQSKQTSQQYKLNIQDVIGEMNLLQQKIQQTAITDKARLNELIPKYRELKAQVDSFNKSMEGTAKASSSVWNAVRLTLVAGLIKETADAVIQMTALAGKIEGVKRAFDKLPNSVLLMDELRQRTHGALTELELMQKALQARNFGIPIEQLGKLLEFAAIKSQQTGISIQYLTESIVTGLGRESIKILDNLQIDIGKLKARMQETGMSMRQVVGDIVNEELKKMGGYLETSETKVNQLKTAWGEFKEELSKSVASNWFIQKLDQAVEGWTVLLKAFREDKTPARIIAESKEISYAIHNINLFREANEKVLKDREKNISLIDKEIRSRDLLAARNKLQIMIIDEEIKALKEKDAFDEKSELATRRSELELRTMGLNEEIKLLKQLRSTSELANEEKKEEAVTIEVLEKRLESLLEARKAINIEDTKALVKNQQQVQFLKDLIAHYQRLGEITKGTPGGPKPFEDNPILAGLAGQVDKDVDESIKRSTEGIQRRMKATLAVYKRGNKEQEAEDRRSAIERERIQNHLVTTTIMAAHQVLSAWNQAASQREDRAIESLDKEGKALDEHYDNLLARTGDNERARQRISTEREQKERQMEGRREAAEIAANERQKQREKKERLRQIAIDTAAGIVRALTVQPGLPAGWSIAGILTGQALIQAAIVNKFKKGVIDLKGPGNETSDSIPAMLSKRESVMTAAETKSSMGILKSIRARKLNDKIFEKLVVNAPATQKTDFSPIVSELRKNRPGDLSRRGVFIYESVEIGKNMKRKIKRASGF